VLDGRWAEAEAFAAPEDDKSSHPSVDRACVRAHVRTQAFLELLDDASLETAAAPDPDALVAALERLREVCDDEDADDGEEARVGAYGEATSCFAVTKRRAPTFRDACAVLALGDVRAHPPLRFWTKARGRLETFEAVKSALAPLYPESDANAFDGARNRRSRKPNERPGALELALRRAVAHATGDDGKPSVSLRSALGFELFDVPELGAGEGVESFKRGEDLPDEGDATMKSVSPSFHVSSATSTQLLHEDLMGAFRETDVNVPVKVNVKEERDSTQTRRRDDDDALSSSPRFALVGDVVRADAGVRCLTRCPRVFNPRESAESECSGVGAFAAATSSRVLHVIADVSRGESPRGGKTKTFSRRLDDAHAGPCSVYAVAWAAADNGGGGVVATGANDGGLALTEVRYNSYGAEEPLRLDENERETFRFGGSCVTRNAVRGGAIRAVAFVGAAASSLDDGDELLRAADARLVVCAGEGDFKPRAWQLDESGLAFAGPSFSLGAHGAPVIAAAADPDTRWLLFTASRAGEAFLWDLRESRGARENLAARPSLRCDVAGACGDGASLSSATIRGGRIAFGFINGGVAAADARRGCNSVAFGGVRRVSASFGGAGSSVVWSDVVHPGFECRSVDIAPRGSSVSSGGSRNDSSACAAFQSPFLILSGGFDGRVALSDASSNGRGSVWSCENAHADKVTAARFDARGAGFVSCGVDRVVKAWALRDENRDRS
jgi:hypothetical protein